MEPTQPTSAIRMPRTQAVANPSTAIFVPSGRYGALMFIRDVARIPTMPPRNPRKKKPAFCPLVFHRHQHLVFPCILGIHLPHSFLFLRKTGPRCLRPCSGTAPCRNLTILRSLWHNLVRVAVK